MFIIKIKKNSFAITAFGSSPKNYHGNGTMTKKVQR